MVVHGDYFWVMVIVKVVAGRKENVCFWLKVKDGNWENQIWQCREKAALNANCE